MTGTPAAAVAIPPGAVIGCRFVTPGKTAGEPLAGAFPLPLVPGCAPVGSAPALAGGLPLPVAAVVAFTVGASRVIITMVGSDGGVGVKIWSGLGTVATLGVGVGSAP